MAFTRVRGTGITTTDNYQVGVITASKFVGPMDGGIGSGTNFVGVITATGLDINGNADVSGNLSVGGTVTYQDVTNVDSVGVGTFQSNVQVGAGISVVGVSTFTGDIDANADIELAGNLAVTGVSTFSGVVNTDADLNTNTINITDGICHRGDLNTKIRFPTADTFTVETDGDERLRINSDGKLLIGHASAIDIGGGTLFQSQITGTNYDTSGFVQTRFEAGGSGPAIVLAHSRHGTKGSHTILQDGDEFGKIRFFGSDGTDFANNGAQIVAKVDGTPGDNDMPGRLEFHTTADGGTSATEKLRIDSSGRLLIAQTDSYNVFAHSKLQVSGTDSLAAASFTRWSANAYGPYINLGKSRGAVGAYTAVQDDDILGTINFAAADGTDLESVGAAIVAEIDGTPGGNDIPGRLVFKTTLDGAASATERLRIDSSGRHGINVTNTGDYYSAADDLIIREKDGGDSGLTIRTGTGNSGLICFADGASSSSDQYRRGQIRYHHNSDSMDFTTAGNTARMNIDSSGSVHIDGPTAAAHGLRFTPNGWNSYDNRMGYCGTSGADFWWSSNWNPTDGARDHSGYATNYIRQNIDTGYLSFGTGAVNASATEKLRIKSTGEVHISDRNSATAGEHVFQAGAFGIRMQDTGGYNRWNIERNYGGWQSDPIVHLSAQGRVGINQASPGSALSVKALGSASDGLQVTSSGHSSYVWQIQNNDNLFNGSLAGELGIRGSSGISFSANAGTSTHLRIKSDGKIGMNMTPHVELDIFGDASSRIVLRTVDGSSTSNHANLSFCIGSGSAPASGNTLGVIESNVTATGGACTGDLRFYTNPGDSLKERLRIDSSGNITAVNTDSGGRSVTLKVGASNASGTNDGIIRIVNGGTGNGVLQWDYEGNAARAQIYVYRSTQDLIFTTAGTEKLRLYSTNASGVGIAKFTSPVSGDMLNLQNSTGSGQGLIFGVDTSNGYTYWKNNTSASYDAAFIVGGSERLRIDSSGRLGINATTWWDSSCALTVYNGNSNSDHTIVDIQADTNETSRISFSEVGDTNKGSIRYHHGNQGDKMTFHTNGSNTERFTIGDNGKITQKTTTNSGNASGFETFSGNSINGMLIYNEGNDTAAALQIRGNNNSGGSPGQQTYTQLTHKGASLEFEITHSSATAFNINSTRRIRVPGVWGVNGSSMRTVQIESDGNLCAPSSIREAKINIESISDVSWLYDFNPVTFNFRTKTEVNGENVWGNEADDGGLQYGLIADEVESVNQDLCFYDDNKLSGVHYDRMIAPLIKALQDQKKEIDDLKTKVAALESS